ncbi:hypothetical protein F2Q68_00044482 [Brassica cretica]|uniref:Uncharacterized protein n=1 Tax=Brassica cretica TaxID=69181 RepID=A0A8S9LMJ7_BRACR|nr:hypothetical protein F2Q68_00044482 [Brassica cretica]
MDLRETPISQIDGVNGDEIHHKLQAKITASESGYMLPEEKLDAPTNSNKLLIETKTSGVVTGDATGLQQASSLDPRWPYLGLWSASRNPVSSVVSPSLLLLLFEDIAPPPDEATDQVTKESHELEVPLTQQDVLHQTEETIEQVPAPFEGTNIKQKKCLVKGAPLSFNLPIAKLPPPELKENGSLCFPWAARMNSATMNLYRASHQLSDLMALVRLSFQLSSYEDVEIPMVSIDSFMEINVSQQTISGSNMVDDTIVLTQEVQHSSSVHGSPYKKSSTVLAPSFPDAKSTPCPKLACSNMVDDTIVLTQEVQHSSSVHGSPYKKSSTVLAPSFPDAKSTPCPKLACSSSVRTTPQIMEDVPSNIVMNDGIVLSVNDPSNMTSFTSEYI